MKLTSQMHRQCGEDAVTGSEMVFPVRPLAGDGLQARKQMVERGGGG